MIVIDKQNMRNGNRKPGPVAQSVASLIAGVLSLIPAQFETFMEINHEKFSMVILLLSLIRPVAQSVASPIADPGVVSLIPAQSETFMEINHEKFSMVILLLSLIQEGLLSVTS